MRVIRGRLGYITINRYRAWFTPFGTRTVQRTYVRGNALYRAWRRIHRDTYREVVGW